MLGGGEGKQLTSLPHIKFNHCVLNKLGLVMLAPPTQHVSHTHPNTLAPPTHLLCLLHLVPSSRIILQKELRAVYYFLRSVSDELKRIKYPGGLSNDTVCNVSLGGVEDFNRHLLWGDTEVTPLSSKTSCREKHCMCEVELGESHNKHVHGFRGVGLELSCPLEESFQGSGTGIISPP